MLCLPLSWLPNLSPLYLATPLTPRLTLPRLELAAVALRHLRNHVPGVSRLVRRPLTRYVGDFRYRRSSASASRADNRCRSGTRHGRGGRVAATLIPAASFQPGRFLYDALSVWSRFFLRCVIASYVVDFGILALVLLPSRCRFGQFVLIH